MTLAVIVGLALTLGPCTSLNTGATATRPATRSNPPADLTLSGPERCANIVAVTASGVPQFARFVEAGRAELLIATTPGQAIELRAYLALPDWSTAGANTDTITGTTIVVDCTRTLKPSARFVILHEIGHAIRQQIDPAWYLVPSAAAEGEADCVAHILNDQLFGERLPLSVGGHGGCPRAMLDPTRAWLASIT